MDPFALPAGHVRDAVGALARSGALKGTPDTSKIVVEPPREADHGDLATNAAMVLAKESGIKPRELAVLIAQKLLDVPRVLKAEVAGPGFINISLEPGVWLDALLAALKAEAGFGRSNLGRGERVNVEFVSAIPLGPTHGGDGLVSGVGA